MKLKDASKEPNLSSEIASSEKPKSTKKKSKEELKRLRALRTPEEVEKCRKVGRHAKSKGGRTERAAVNFLKELGCPSARRTSQYCGTKEGDADVVVPEELPLFHLEIKGEERLNVYEAVEQAVRDASKTGNIPIVMHKRNHSPWLVYMPAEYWVRMAKRVQAQIDKEIEEALHENDSNP